MSCQESKTLVRRRQNSTLSLQDCAAPTGYARGTLPCVRTPMAKAVIWFMHGRALVTNITTGTVNRSA
eukprot:2809637-Amphidinium_carterae.1